MNGAVSGDRHLVGVWNPSYATDAMQEHLALLLRFIGEHRDGKLPVEDVFVWWGRIRSGNRQKPLVHLDDVLSLGESLEQRDAEAHLYLTDYRSLYVGELLEITDDDVRVDDGPHVPAYYADYQCDYWFRLGDVRRLVQDDTVQVIAELRELRNVHYNDRPVSLYGGMVDLPLIVTRDDGVRYFDRSERTGLLDGRFWADIDASRTGLGAIERDLRENLLGEAVWAALEPSARTFIAAAEQTLRTNRNAPGFDFAGVVLNLAKACEVQANHVVRVALAKAPLKERQVKRKAGTVDVVMDGPLSLGELARTLREEEALRRALGGRGRGARWLANEGAHALENLSRYRNPAAHSDPISLPDALRLRDHWLGVGCQGHLVQLVAGGA
ncbi:MAG: hypothetical protein ACREOF_00500 [Gemmatimonadales bacterium]